MSGAECNPVRVVVVAASLALRAGLRALLSAGGAIEVTGEAAGLAEIRLPLAQADVLVVEWDAGDPQLPEESVPTLLLVNHDAEAVQALAGRPRRAWGLLPLDSSAEEMRAAVLALHQGLIVAAPGLLEAHLDRPAGPPLAAPLVEPLTERELEVLQLLAQGLANKQIALALQISEHTVKFHVSALYAKLGAANRTEAVRIGVRQGLIVL
jgi:DNA-binding NarL/FixJ family response regulator